jgi:hypothetical protein
MRIRLLHNKINGTIADGGSLGLSAIGRFLCVLTQRIARLRASIAEIR